MQKFLFFILLSMGLMGAMSKGAHSASFNCNKASTSLEKTICGNPALNSLDSELGRLYKAVRGQLAGDGKKLFKSEHRKWLKSRAKNCPSTESACLIMQYTLRNAQLLFQDTLYVEQRKELVKESDACDYRVSRPIYLAKDKGGFIATAQYSAEKCVASTLHLSIVNSQNNEIVFQKGVSMQTLTMYQGDLNAKALKSWAKTEIIEKLNELVNIRQWPEFKFSSVEEKYSQQVLWQKTYDRTDLSSAKKWDILNVLEECGFEYSITKKSYDMYSQQDLPLFGYSFGENGSYFSYVPSIGKVIEIGGGCY